VARKSGFPIVSPARAVVDLARTERLEVATSIMSDALRTGIADQDQVRAQLEAARGRVGIEQARAALGQADPRLESVLEDELLALIGVAGFVVLPQFEVFDGGRFVARVDFAVPELRLALEADGYAFHARRSGFERDRERHALLHLASWTALSFTAHQIRRRPDWVVDVMVAMAAKLAA
jgi:very-short-patch-repair endonuclease